MRAALLLLLLLLLGSSMASGQSARDTADIRRAVADSGERVDKLIIVADTAWARVYDPRKATPVGDTGDGRSLIRVQLRHVRFERRDGKWVRREKLSPISASPTLARPARMETGTGQIGWPPLTRHHSAREMSVRAVSSCAES